MKVISKISLIAFSVLSFNVNAGQSAGTNSNNDKCGIVKYTNYKKANDPSLSQRLIEDEKNLQRFINNSNVTKSINTIYTIPVVVHVVYNPNQLNISDAQIQSQIDVLNEDFSRTNLDAANTPGPFANAASSTSFQFCLAKRDPNNAPTNGIERRQTTITTFGADNQVKFYSSGGLDAWDIDNYLNIWVCNLQDRILGFGDLPTSIHTNTYGVVVKDSAFGRSGVVIYPYNKGRTCTHEISHCFDLYHIWGDADSCLGTDFVMDTPGQLGPTYGCHSFPFSDYCSPNYPGAMFMNYMDYSDDNCMNMFTAGQADRMINSISLFYPLLLSSTTCMTDGIESLSNLDFSVYPNPTRGKVNLDLFTTNNNGIELHIRVENVLGKTVLETTTSDSDKLIYQLDLDMFSSGVYFLTVYNESQKRTERIVLNK